MICYDRVKERTYGKKKTTLALASAGLSASEKESSASMTGAGRVLISSVSYWRIVQVSSSRFDHK